MYANNNANGKSCDDSECVWNKQDEHFVYFSQHKVRSHESTYSQE